MSFMDRVEKVTESGCWLWTGNLLKGYGRMPGSQLRAHRVSYEMHKGHIPPDICVLHRCDVPCCVNPGHLFLGTHTDNNRDKVLKGRQKGGGRRLAPHLVAAIRESKLSLRKTARQLGVSKFAVIKYRSEQHGT